MIFARKLLAELNEGSIGHLIPRPLAKASQSDMFQQRPAIIRSIHQHRHLSLPPVSSLPSSNAAMEVEDCDTNLALSIGGVRNDCKEKPPINQLQEKEEEEDYSVRKRRSKSRSEDTETANKFNVNSSYQVGGGRKKLRLNKEQMGLLEDSFTEHSTLNSNQKQELASRLNILPRQVEVWFQNRRARSKLKQIEDEFERLKKWSEKLSDENRRLKEEIEELRRRRRGSPASPLYVCLTKAAPPPLPPPPPPPPPPSMCPSCGQRAAAALASGTDDSFSVKREKDNWNLYIMG